MKATAALSKVKKKILILRKKKKVYKSCKRVLESNVNKFEMKEKTSTGT